MRQGLEVRSKELKKDGSKQTKHSRSYNRRSKHFRGNELTGRNSVIVYKTYADKRPSTMKDSDSPFHLGINHIKSSSTSDWFWLWFKSSEHYGCKAGLDEK